MPTVEDDMAEGKKETHVHEWWLEERRMGYSIICTWTCRVPGCQTRRFGQVEKVGSPYPDLPETEEVKPARAYIAGCPECEAEAAEAKVRT
jgi:hypothetical protein